MVLCLWYVGELGGRLKIRTNNDGRCDCNMNNRDL